MRLFILIFTFLFIHGCATVNSKFQSTADLISNKNKPENITGLLYFLPKKQITLTATQTPITAKTIKDSQEALTKATNEVNKAKIAANASRQAFADIQTAFAKNNGGTAEAFAQKIAANEIVLKTKEVVLARTEAIRDKAAATLAEAKSAHSAGIPVYTVKVELAAPEPDVNFAFRAEFKHNWLRDDEFSLSINNRGLLSTSKVSATDQTSQILAELAGASAAIGAELPELSSISLEQSMLSLSSEIGGDKGTGDDIDPELVKIPTCDFPIDQPHKFQVTFDPTNKNEDVGFTLSKVNKLLSKCFPYSLSVVPPMAMSNISFTGFNSADDKKENTSDEEKTSVDVNGLVYRPALPYVLTVNQCTSDFANLGTNNDRAYISCGRPSLGDAFKQQAQRGAIAENLIKSLESSQQKFKQLGSDRKKHKINTRYCKLKAKKSIPLCVWYNETEHLADLLNTWHTNASFDDDHSPKPVSPALGKILTSKFPKNKEEKKVAQDVLRIAQSLRDAIYIGDPKDRALEPIQSTIAMLPNNAPLSIIPMKANAFVKSVHDVTFENGMVTKWDRNAPSEVLEIVRLPIKILTKILEAPAQIFQLKINLSNNQNSLVDAQRSQIESQLALQLLQDCIAKAEAGRQEFSTCMPEEP